MEEQEKQILNDTEINNRKMYYSRIFILFEMVKWMRSKETVFLNTYNRMDNIRCMNIGTVDMLLHQFGLQTDSEKEQDKKPSDAWHFFASKKNYNIYTSLSVLDWISCPIKAFSYAHKDRSEQQEFLKKNIQKYLLDFYGGIDFDGDLNGSDEKGHPIILDISREDAVKRAYEDCKKASRVFDEFSIKYYIQFSGSRGFHILFELPFEIIKPNPNILQTGITVNQKCDLASLISDRLRTTLDLKTMDKARLHLRKVFKTPYSIVTKDKSRVVLPLTPEQFDNFSLKIVDLSYVLNKTKIKDRGACWRNIYKSETTRVRDMMESFEIKMPEHKTYRVI